METRKILIATKTYPSISTKYQETVCTAGILLSEEENPLQWIRIYPIRYRYLDFDKRYPRWAIVSAKIKKNDQDYRPESFRIDDNSLQIIRKIDTTNNWQERKSLVLSLQFRSIADIQAQGKSLGIIKPKSIERFFSKKTSREWNQKQQAVLNQLDLFEPNIDLEKIPYQFVYQFTDEDNVPHKYSISDWEIMELYRKCRDRSQLLGLEAEQYALEKVRQKLEDDFLESKDLYFIVGNLKNHAKSFMIIGLFYPPLVKFNQMELF
ncbi:MAG: hypothetical protein GPJ22_24850 [Microcystis aeruginosa LL13-03]|jgi:hypothetical protein|nr:hypothetical protein [Microcystis aeruginosa LL13-03]NCR69400.1 hypothetical protein [Microcystis aeruginosa LL11-07]NCS09505.1 hypothetical protein [Microcystis aeruginosa G13-07]NCS18378.1 hypothetical protein [Microcystis aeruginosa G13-12]NCS41985.1 hypothetical protein [Microcystis aeruginosa BS13-10]NCT46135.1 hypothetical protein [Microcystis aeruginosa G11-09]NCT54077.1 hypothetical protein [Microcystis aeruginosa G13-03]NCT65896.1 hypothetical protein [Microcystis aeruginosa G13-